MTLTDPKHTQKNLKKVQIICFHFRLGLMFSQHAKVHTPCLIESHQSEIFVIVVNILVYQIQTKTRQSSSRLQFRDQFA